MRIRTILAVAAATAVAAACSAPTLPQAERRTPLPGGAAFDGGVGLGSGGFVGDTTTRSGVGLGSGG